MKYLLILFLAFAIAFLAGTLTACDSHTTASVSKSPDTTASTVNTDNSNKELTMSTANPSSNEFPVTHTDAEWKKMLTPEEYAVLREKATDRPFQNKYDEFFQPGTYSCAACGQELFSSDTKFNSGCGWPAFYAAKAGDKVKLLHDNSYGMDRVEVVCSRCGSHLGHLFDDAPQTPTGQRFCINSTSVKFTPATTTQPAPK